MSQNKYEPDAICSHASVHFSSIGSFWLSQDLTLTSFTGSHVSLLCFQLTHFFPRKLFSNPITLSCYLYAPPFSSLFLSMAKIFLSVRDNVPAIFETQEPGTHTLPNI